jgi:hypothetical protein
MLIHGDGGRESMRDARSCSNSHARRGAVVAAWRCRILRSGIAALALATVFAHAAEPAASNAPAGSSEPGEELREQARALKIELPAAAPARAEGEGPFVRLVVEEVMLIDGRGGPPRGPVRIEIAGDHIHAILPAGEGPPTEGAEIIDGRGMYALPGFIDAHAHLGSPFQGLAGPIAPPEYVFKLWLGHGITTVREMGATLGLSWTLGQKQRAELNQITAPRLGVYALFPGDTLQYDADARRWVRLVFNRGADGVALRGATLEATRAVIEEATRLGMRTARQHDQVSVYEVNALASARLGLTSLEHWHGLPEALFETQSIQNLPPDHNYADEQARYVEAAYVWEQAAGPGSDRWFAVRDELIALGLTLVPTFAGYDANRDLAGARNAEWHTAYTWPSLYRSFQPDPRLRGGYQFDWTTADEIAWRRHFARWMTFVNDYKNAGGRVAAGSSAGTSYSIPGIGFVRELELLQEAGFNPLEVVQAATLNGAELLGIGEQTGSLVPGKKADVVLVGENPLANFKVLYGTGHPRFDRRAGTTARVGGVRYTIRDGIVYDAVALRADVRNMVRAARVAR